MGDCSDSLARRRELRKRKILENAELRKQKIFGIGSSSLDNSAPNELNSSFKENNNASGLQEKNNSSFHETNNTSNLHGIHNTSTSSFHDDHDETASTKSMESEISSKSLNTDGFVYSSNDINRLNEILRNIPDPLLEFANGNEAGGETIGDNGTGTLPDEGTDESRFMNSIPSDTFGSSYNTSSIHSNSGGSNIFNNTNDRSFINSTPNFLLVFLEHPVAPCFLALIVCFLILFDFGNLVSNSLVIPFCIWEIQQIIASYGNMEAKEENGSVLEAALLLCGIKKSIIIKYIWISKLVKDIQEDFALYVITIVLWQFIIGFPPIEVKE